MEQTAAIIGHHRPGRHCWREEGGEGGGERGGGSMQCLSWVFRSVTFYGGKAPSIAEIYAILENA